MSRWRAVLLAAATITTLAPAIPAQTTGPVDAAAATMWREDLAHFAHFLATEHGDAFHSVSRERFESMVRELDERIPTLARHEFVVELQRIAAAIGDGHTAVQLFFDPDVDFHQLPVRLAWYEEGIFVEAARDDAGVPPGARLVAIGGVPIDEAIDRVTPLVSRDNDIWIRVLAPMLLGSPEVLHALGLSDDPASARLTVERAGERRSVRLAARDEPFVISHGEGVDHALPPGWRTARLTDAPTPLRERNPGVPYWYEYLPEARVLYIQYDMVNDAPHGPGVHAFFAEALATLDSEPTDRVVLDIRDNSGGEGMLNTGVVRMLLRRPELQPPGRLVVIIGRRTFSAAQALAHDLDRWTPAVFIGEPTGSSPQFWGDHRMIELPNSRIAVSASPTWWQPGGPYDTRPHLPPVLAFEPRFADYVAGRDPAMEAVVDWEAQELEFHLPLDDAAVAGLAARDLDALARLDDAARAWDADPVHRYRPATAELNRIGYALLGRGRSDAAIAVFERNVALHPDYANGWDSLGDALLRAGRREAGLTAYRRAYELDPDVGTAAQVLEEAAGH